MSETAKPQHTHRSDAAEQARALEQIAGQARSGYRTVEDMVVAAIREAILSGVFAPGEKLPQEALAQSLGVSRIPVRSALRQLEAEGLATFSPHRGATVRSLSPLDVAEIYQLRIVLETFALRSAISSIEAPDIDELEVMADRLDALGEGEEWLDLRERFYERLYGVAGRGRTAALISRLRADVGRYWLSLKVVNHEGGTAHRVMIDAVRARDSEKAEDWLREHLTKVSQQLQHRVSEQASHVRT